MPLTKSRVFRNAGSGGGGSTPTGDSQWVIVGEFQTTSYVTGGFVIDLDATVTSLNFVTLAVKTIGSLPIVQYRYNRNFPSGNGQVKVQLFTKQYDRVSSFNTPTNLPASVTLRATSGQVSSSESTHTHSTTHDHASFASGAASTGAGQVLLDALGPSLATHTHPLDLPSLVGTSGAGGAHNHVDNSLYTHSHTLTKTTTNLSMVEMTNGTSLSGTVWYLFATGLKR